MRSAARWGLPIVVLLLCLASPAAAQLSVLETEDLRLVYMSPTQSFLASHVARCFENSMRFQRRLFDYTPSQKVTVLLSDLSDSGNAGAGVVPRNNLTVQIAPLNFAYETMVANERMNTIMNHELVHIVANEKPAGSERFFRGLFRGKVAPVAEQPETILYFYLTTPRAAAPRWYHEGIAVFLDTWMAGGLGRAQGAYDEMVFRAMVRDDSRFYDPLGLASEGTKVDFQLETNSYLYGTRFLSYLAYEHSPESLIRWVSRSNGSRAYYSAEFKKVYGTSLEDAWRRWIEWERQFQKSNLEAVRKYPTTPFHDLSKQALGSVSRAYVDAETHKLYAAFNYPGVVGHVGAISLEDGGLEKLRDVKEPAMYTVTSLAYDPDSGTIFYTNDNYAYRDLVSLEARTRKARTLLKDARVGELTFNRIDRSLWGIRTFNGICTLVRIPFPYSEWKTVRSWPYGEVVYDIDISPDGLLLSASVGEIDGRQLLRVMKLDSLLSGDATPTAEVEFGSAIPSNFVFSPDGKYLYGSSYYTGVANIFRYEPAAGKLQAVSNAETGFFRPIPLGGDSLIVFRFTGEGFVPAQIEAKPLEDVTAITFLGHLIAEKHPVVKSWGVGSPAAIALDSTNTRSGPYRSLRGVGLESTYPVAQGYKDSVAAGVRLNFSDPLRLNNLSFVASYSPGSELSGSERLHVEAEYLRYDWKAAFKLNGADFYDLFGPTKTSRKGYSLRLGYLSTLIYDTPRKLELSLDGAFYGSLDRLPDFQNVAAPFDQLLTARARLSYSNLRHSLGHVDEEKGHRWDLVIADDHANGKSFPKFRGDFDFGLALGLKHSSVWLRTSAGYSPGERSDALANFYFGGFGNNWVDHGDEKRYREYYSFPGVKLNEIQGRSYAKSTLEWSLPPLRFRRAGTPGVYLTWARPALFATNIVTNLDVPRARRVVTDVGSQLDFRFSLLSRLDMTLSFGYAFAFEAGLRPRHESMVSLKVLN